MGTKVYDNYADLITFNRNSKGTALRPIGYGDELVTNGTFDTDSDWAKNSLWAISGGVATQPAGASPDYLKQSDVLTIGKVYQYSIEVVSGNGSNFPQLYTEAGVVASFTSGVGTYTGIFVAAGNDVWIRALSPTIDVSVDNVSVKEVLFDREGDPLTLFLHPEGVPRIEYDADRNLKGLLIEPDGQNICLQSGDFGTFWTQTNVTVATDATTAPDGNTTADKIKANTTSQTYVIQKGYAPNPSANHTFSVFAKKDELNYIQLSFANTTQQYANFDLDLGVVGTKGTAANSSTIEDYGNGWYRCSVHINAGTLPSFGIAIVPSASATWRQSVSAGSATEGVFLWGAQLETGSVATSYIPTTTGQENRVKDDITLGSASSLIGQTEGTLYVEVYFRQTGLDQRMLQVSDGTGANRIIIWAYSTNTYIDISIGNSNVVNQGAPSLADGVQKFALAYANGDQEFYRNGSSIATDAASLAALPTLTDIDLGQSAGSGTQANMWIRAAALFTRRLSDSECIALTTL